MRVVVVQWQWNCITFACFSVILEVMEKHQKIRRHHTYLYVFAYDNPPHPTGDNAENLCCILTLREVKNSMKCIQCSSVDTASTIVIISTHSAVAIGPSVFMSFIQMTFATIHSQPIWTVASSSAASATVPYELTSRFSGQSIMNISNQLFEPRIYWVEARTRCWRPIESKSNVLISLCYVQMKEWEDTCPMRFVPNGLFICRFICIEAQQCIAMHYPGQPMCPFGTISWTFEMSDNFLV